MKIIGHVTINKERYKVEKDENGEKYIDGKPFKEFVKEKAREALIESAKNQPNEIHEENPSD